MKGSSGVAIGCTLLMAACFALDVVTPQLLVVAILLNVPIALASTALGRRTTIAFMLAAEILNVLAAFVNGAHDGYSWSALAVGDRGLVALSFLFVGFLSVRTQEAVALGAISAERQRTAVRERRLRQAIERVRESLSPELVERAIVAELLGLLKAERVIEGRDGDIAPWPLHGSPAALAARLRERGRRAIRLERNNPVDGLLLDDLRARAGAIVRVDDAAGALVLAFALNASVADDDVLAIESFAAAAALALEQARLVERLDERTVAIAAQKDQLVQRGEVIRDIVYALAHDLRTPIQAADVTMRHAMEGVYGELPERYHEILRATLASNDDASRLIDTLLMVARYESGDLSLDDRPVVLREIAMRAVADTAPIASLRDVTVTVEIGSDAVVYADVMELRRALVNLVSNAIAASPAGSHVTLDVRDDGPNVRIAVADDGYGVPAVARDRLFQRFGRDGRAPGAGTGLGLYVVRRIVERIGGTVAYRPRDSGSEFSIELPRYRAEDA
ncbi:MAG TPA: HAMP domain-containing sensor histidine kinase [Candidatus Baltobacteraceae bacterium]